MQETLKVLARNNIYGLIYTADGDLEINGFTYVDWEGDGNNRRSIGAYSIYLGNNFIF